MLAAIVRQAVDLHAGGRDVVLVISGAISRGINLLGLNARPAAMDELQAASAVGQGRLFRLYDEFFAESGIKTAQILLTFADMSARTNYVNARHTLSKLLDWRVVPMINENDTTATDEISFGDNDFLTKFPGSQRKTHYPAPNLPSCRVGARGAEDRKSRKAGRFLEMLEPVDGVRSYVVADSFDRPVTTIRWEKTSPIPRRPSRWGWYVGGKWAGHDATRAFEVQGTACKQTSRKKPKSCTRYKSLGSFTHSDIAGTNTFRFTGRLKSKALKLGKYRLSVVAKNGSLSSKPVTARFKIKR